MSIVKGRGYIIGGESTSLPFQSCDDILQTVGIFRYFLSNSNRYCRLSSSDDAMTIRECRLLHSAGNSLQEVLICLATRP